jgi:hypothetical protein
MKILYAEGNFLQKGHQILAYPATVGAAASHEIEKSVLKTVPEIRESVFNMFAINPEYDVEPPRLGDVIWTETSGRKWYAHCIIYDENGELSFPAFDLCMKSLAKKADELGHEQIGMPLAWFREKKNKIMWERMFPSIEDNIGEHAQVFVYEHDKEFLMSMIDSLPGSKRAYYADVKIQFRDM